MAGKPADPAGDAATAAAWRPLIRPGLARGDRVGALLLHLQVDVAGFKAATGDSSRSSEGPVAPHHRAVDGDGAGPAGDRDRDGATRGPGGADGQTEPIGATPGGPADI